jgi:exonuclease III
LELSGLNSAARQDSVRILVDASKFDVVCLQETKMITIPWQLVLSMLGSEFDNNFICLPSEGASVGILVSWRNHLGTVGAIRVDAHSVSVQFCPSDGSAWWLTCVYGPQQDHDKIQFLQELRDVRAQCSGPWLVLGDFNLIYKEEDKNNSNLNRAMMGRFRRWINDLGVSEIPLQQQQQQQHSLLSQASWGRLEMKLKRDEKQGV